MKQLGATEFYYKGEADDATGLEEVVEPWLENIEKEVQDIDKKIAAYSDDKRTEMLKLETNPVVSEKKKEKDEGPSTIQAYLTLDSIQTLNQSRDYDDAKSLYKVSLTINQPKKGSQVGPVHLQAGQSIALFPQNAMEGIDTCVNAFGWNKEEYLGNNTVGEMLQKDLDIKSLKINMDKLWDKDVVQTNREWIT